MLSIFHIFFKVIDYKEIINMLFLLNPLFSLHFFKETNILKGYILNPGYRCKSVQMFDVSFLHMMALHSYMVLHTQVGTPSLSAAAAGHLIWIWAPSRS